MKRNSKAAGKQRGFTLVEMSVTMAAAGLLFSAVTTGQELIDQAKATKLINDVKTVEMQIQQYAQLKSRLPGDCDADGVIDYAADNNTTTSLRTDTGNTARAEEYSYSVLQPTTPADGASAAAQTDGCALMGSGDTATIYDVVTDGSETNANVWLNDLKLAGVVGDSASNRKLAKMVNEDFLFVGNVTDAGTESADAASYNAIVIHNVPQWMARRLSTSINGQDARADRSRVRLLERVTSTEGDYSELWQTQQAGATATPATRDGMVSVVYFFDRVPESKMGAVAAAAD